MVTLVGAMPAFAQVHEPDVTFLIKQCEVYRNVIELNDQLYLITYEADWNMNPTMEIDQTFLFRLMNGATELATVTAYPYFESGYDLGIASIYFDADSAPAWNGAYTVEFRGNPTLHWLDTTATTAMAGAVQDDGTDETAAANDAVPNDMTLMPNPPVVGSDYYFGSNGMFDILTVNIGTVGTSTYTYTWEYWDGSVWTAVTGLNDGTNGFTVGTGIYDVTYDCPTDWQQVAVSGIMAYWLRIRIVTYTAPPGVQPLGTQAWTNTLANPPLTSTGVFSLWYDGGTVAATQSRLATRLRAVANILETDWGALAPLTDLIESVAGIEVLTVGGEEYFTNAIPGLRTMCPDIFADIMTTPEFEEYLVVGDFNTGGDDVDEDYYGVDWYAQTFTASVDYTLNGVYLRLFRTGAAVNTTVHIRNTLGGFPTGANLVSGTIAGDYTTNDIGAWYQVTFSTDLALTQGTTYAIVVTAPGGNVANFASWRANSGSYAYIGAGGVSGNYYYIGSTLAAGGVFYVGSSIFGGGSVYMGTGAAGASYYAGGQACVSGDSGVTWGAVAGGAYDFMFATTAREDYTVSYRDMLANRLVGTRFDMTNLATNLGMSRMWASTLVWLIFVILLPTIYLCRWAKSYKPATLTMMLLLPIGALAGFIYLEVAIIAAMMSAAAAIYVFFFSRAG